MRQALRGIAVVTALVVLAGCTGGTGRTASTPTRSPSPSASPSASSSPSSVAPSRVLVGSLSLAVPSGWTSAADTGFDHVCLEPPHPRERMFGCGGLDIYYGWTGWLPSNERTNFITDGPGWYHATDVQPCPVKPKQGPGSLNGTRPGPLLDRGTAPVGHRTANYYRWSATCDNGFRFTPRAWYLPVSKVVVFDYVGVADNADVLRHADFDGRWIVGYLHATHGSTGALTVDVDEFTWLSGDVANAYAARHGMEHPVPNDYLIVDDNTTTVPMRVSPRVSVRSDFQLAGSEPGRMKQVSLDRLVAFLGDKANWTTPFHLHIDDAGVIDRIQEQFRP